MRAVRVLAACGLLLAGAPSVLGQSYRTFREELVEVRTRARLRFGPFRLIPTIRLRDIGYDDNVYFRSSSERPVADYTGSLSPEITAYLLLGRTLMLSFTESPEYSFFAKETRLRAFTNSYSPGLRLNLLDRFTVSGEYHMRRRQRRAYSEFSGLVTDTTEGGTVSAFLETPRGTSLGVSGRIDRFGYEDVVLGGVETPYSRTLNRKETTGNVELYYPVFAQSALFLTAGSTSYEFDHPSARWRNSTSVQASAGLRFPFAGRARGRLSLGYKKFTPETAGREPFSGLIADTDIDLRLGRFALRLGVGRELQFSYLEEAFYYVETGVRPGLSFYLTRRLRLDYDFRSSVLDYADVLVVPDPELGSRSVARKDDHTSHSVGLSIFFFRRTGLQISYNIFERNSNVPGFDRRRSFIGVSLVQDF